LDTLGYRLQKLIDSKGITPYEVSKETGVPESTLSRILTKGSKPNKKNRDKLADYFQVSPEYLLTGYESISLIKDNIKIDDSLFDRKEEFRSIVFYMSENMEKLMQDEVFKMFIDRIKSEGRAELRVELAKEFDAEAEKEKSIIKNSLSQEESNSK